MEPHKKTNVSPRQLKTIKLLHADGVGVREIARRVGLSPTTVCVLLHLPIEAIKRRRCPTCGMLIEGDVCRRCALLNEIDAPDMEDDSEEDEDEDDEDIDDEEEEDDGDLRLNLRPAELARYWQVRPLAEARYAKMAEMREKLNLEHDAKERRNP